MLFDILHCLILTMVLADLSIVSWILVKILGEINKTPSKPKIKSPKRVLSEKRAKKEMNEQIKKANLILENIERYDGTALGQKEIK